MHLEGKGETRVWGCCQLWKDVVPTQRPRVSRICAAQVRVTWATFFFCWVPLKGSDNLTRTPHPPISNPLSPVTFHLRLPRRTLSCHRHCRFPSPRVLDDPQVGDVIITPFLEEKSNQLID